MIAVCRSFCRVVVGAGLVLSVVATCAAQAERSGAFIDESPLTPSATNNNAGPTGLIPQERGFNASLITSSQHDSAAGWSNVLTPSVAYRLNPFLSFDAAASVYTYINVARNATTAKATSKTAVTGYKTVHDAPGDTTLAGHLQLPLFASLTYTLTPTLGLPTGDSKNGIGAGQVTYDINNHLEADIPLSPYVEFGFGDTSNLLNQRVKRNQTTVGSLAHFEAGGDVDLPFQASFDVSMYESLPLGSQTITATKTVRKQSVTRIVGTTGLAEDNGFNTSLDLPLQRHVTLSGFYTRSLRQHSDTAGFSLAFFVRPRHPENSSGK